MKVSQEKYQAIKRAKGSITNVGAKFGVSDTTVRRIRGSLNYEAYKGIMAKPKKASLPKAMASGKKKAGSNSSTSKSKTTDNTKSNLNKDKSNKEMETVSVVTCKLNEEHPDNKKFEEAEVTKKINEWVNGDDEKKLSKKYYALLDSYIKAKDMLKATTNNLKLMIIVAVVLLIAFIIAVIL